MILLIVQRLNHAVKCVSHVFLEMMKFGLILHLSRQAAVYEVKKCYGLTQA